jgi:hypothetical protein
MLYVVLNRCPRFILVPLDHRQDSSLENLAYYTGISPTPFGTVLRKTYTLVIGALLVQLILNGRSQ